MKVLQKASSKGTGVSSSSNGGDDNPLAGIPEYERNKETSKYYYPDDGSQRCQGGIVEYKCEEVWYNRLTHVCTKTGVKTIERCGNEFYYVSNSENRCNNGVQEQKCDNGEWYNRKTHYCDSDYDCNEDGCTYSSYTVKAKTLCGNEYYYPYEGVTRCKAGVIEEKCGGETESWYNPKTHYCSYYDATNPVKAIVNCGLWEVSDDYERCNSGVFERLCGSLGNENAVWYNRITQSCDDSNYQLPVVKNKQRCGS